MLKETRSFDDNENSLLFVPIDEDGFQIREIEGKGEVYVYYSEIPLLIEHLRRIAELEKNHL